MKAPQATSRHAIVGIPICQQRAPLVPEVADIDRAECVIAMLVCCADDVVPVRLVPGKSLDFQSGRRQVGEIVKQVLRTFGTQPMRIEANDCFAFGYKVHFTIRRTLDEGEGVLAEQCSVAAAVRA